MDPNATIDNLNDFLDDTSCVDAEDIQEQADALSQWLSRGGFEPDWTRATESTIRYLARQGIAVPA